MPVRPSTEDWSQETRTTAPEDVEAEAPSRDVDEDPDACAGEEIPDPLDAE